MKVRKKREKKLMIKMIINVEDVGLRLDKFLLVKYPDKTRSHIKHWIESDIVTVNGKTVKAGYIIKQTDDIEVKEEPCEKTPKKSIKRFLYK